jgi:hypothetical protein
MIESGCAGFSLPKLDRTDDPQGGAAAWAVLVVAAALVAGVALAVVWAAGVW